MNGKPLTEEQANAAWNVLVEHAGAHEPMRDEFVFHAMRGAPEFRFQGSLGFGGKFRTDRDGCCVDCYTEDLTPERKSALEATNAALVGLGLAEVAW